MHVPAVNTISRTSPDYPVLLNRVSGAPDPLYCLGDYKPEMFDKTLAVVGSRAVTSYGEWVINNIVRDIAGFGITIVSGFMYGVDALAHQAALAVGGKTVAVMAGGIGCIFPKQQENLYWEIAEKGLVVSEYYQPNFGGGWMFARRNRIVAGLSYATLVVEAGEGSGSLITANYTKEYGRQLLAIPGNLSAPNCSGTMQLIKEGAKLVTCANDILALYFPDFDSCRLKVYSAVNKRLKLAVADEVSVKIVELLCLEPLTVDELSCRLQLSVEEILQCITGLCILGHVKEKGGKYCVDQS